MSRGNIVRRVAWALLAWALCAASEAVAAGAVSWIEPPPNALVTQNPVTIKGYLSEPLKKGAQTATVRRPGDPAILGEAPLKLSAGQLFSVTLPLSRGRNDITLGGAVLSLYHLPPGEEKNPRLPPDAAGFRVPATHTPGGLDCSACHWVHQGELTLNDEMPQLCLRCHKVGTISADARRPADNEHSRKITPFCVGCHDPHGTYYPKLMKREGDACARCHTKLTGLSGHEKAGPQPCATCHNPHQSVFKKLLRADAAELCATCHRKVADMSGARSRHTPVRSEPCARCHTHHVAKAPKLLKADDPELCRECHPKIRLPAHERDYPRCGACHAPHSSDQLGLLSTDRPPKCASCHDDPDTSQKSHSALKSRACVECHNPHLDIKMRSARTLCGTCHPFGDPGFTRAHADLPFGSVNQCLLCHQAHGASEHPALLSGEPHFPTRNGGCAVCHNITEGKLVLRYAGSENCIRCHGRAVGISTSMEPEKIHAPISQQDCSACHDPHVLTRKAMLLEEPEKLCDYCHGAMVRMGPVKHGVFINGNCLTCHVPHFSDDRPLLKKTQPQLCLDCHPNSVPRDFAKNELVHGALRQLQCTQCHTPHTADDKKLFTQPREALCASCHPEILKNPKGEPFSDLHGPVGTGTCSACHYFSHTHRAKNDRFLLQTPAYKICADCHDITDAHIPADDRVRLNRIAGGCLGCHAPHGAMNRLMLKAY